MAGLQVTVQSQECRLRGWPGGGLPGVTLGVAYFQMRSRNNLRGSPRAGLRPLAGLPEMWGGGARGSPTLCVSIDRRLPDPLQA